MQEEVTETATVYIQWMLQTDNDKRRQLGYKRFERLLQTQDLKEELQELYDSVDLGEDLSEANRQEYRKMFLVPLALPTLNYMNF